MRWLAAAAVVASLTTVAPTPASAQADAFSDVADGVHKPAHMVKTLTWDQGREMARWAHIENALGIKVYFCEPRSPWQRPTNEQTNGLLRR